MPGTLRQQLDALNQCSDVLDDAVHQKRSISSTLGAVLTIICDHLPAPDLIGTLVFYPFAGPLLGLSWTRRTGIQTEASETIERGLIRLSHHAKKALAEPDLHHHRPTGYIDIVASVRAEIAMPVFLGERIICVIDVASSRANVLPEEDKLWLQQIATLLHFTYFARIHLEPHQEAVAHEIAQDLASGQDVDLVLDKILKSALDITGLPEAYAAILVLDSDRVVSKRAYRMRQGQPVANPVEGEHEWSLSRGITGRALRSGSVTVVNEVTADPDYFPGPTAIHSEAVIPITRGVDHLVIGALDVQAPIHNAFTEDNIIELTALAEQINLALYTAQLSETLKREQSVFEKLADVAPSVVQSLDPHYVYHLILEAIFSLLPSVSLCQILTVETDQETGQQTLVIERSLDKTQRLGDWRTLAAVEHRHPVSHGITGDVARTQRTQYTPDVRTRADYIQYSPQTRSELAIPLALGGAVLGVLNMESEEVDGFSHRDRQVAELLASEAVFTISNAQNFARTIALLNAVADATRGVVGAMEDVGMLIDSILRGAMQVTRAEDGYCALILIEDGLLKIKRERSEFLLPGRKMEWALSDGLTGRAIQTKQPVYIKDVRQDPTYIAATPTTRSNLVVPLLNQRHEAVGALSLESPLLNAFDEQAIRALGQFGPPVVAALEKSDLVRTLQERQQETVDLIKQVAHLLRSPVGVLKETFQPERTPTVAVAPMPALQASESATAFLDLMLEWLDAQADVLGQSFAQHERRRFDVRALVASAVQAYRFYATRKGLELADLPAGEHALVDADREEVLGAFVEVLANAVKYNRPHGRIRVFVDQVLNDVHLVVEDEGVGIPEGEQDRIFERAVRGSNVGGFRGTGLGLYFVRAALRRQGGEAYVEPRTTQGEQGDIQGSRFILQLPLAR